MADPSGGCRFPPGARRAERFSRSAGLLIPTGKPSPNENEVILDKADGMDWPTFCKCDCIYAIPRDELKKHRGTVALERRRQIVRAIIISHGWNAL